MKHFSLMIFICCILLPPFSYIFSVDLLEKYLNKRCIEEIEDVFIGDTSYLFKGQFRLRDVIENNVDTYLRNNRLFYWGVDIKVVIKTDKGVILYPRVYQEKESLLTVADSMQIAAENYNLMNQGLVVDLNLAIKHNSILSNSILVFYVMISVMLLYFYYRKGARKIRHEEKDRTKEINNLIKQKKKYIKRLDDLDMERHKLASKLSKLEKEKIRADINENEMIEEIVLLENEIKKKKSLQNRQKEEIERLKKKLSCFEKASKKKLDKENRTEKMIRKRFKVLYQNISFNDKAIDGFANLTEDMKIKGEQIIHQLNDDSALVDIKRKVFRKKRGDTILEVIFAYMGRLYFSKTKDNKINILAIGTKNTQSKDLDFLDNI